MSAYDHLRHEDQNGFDIAIENQYRAGIEVVRGIVTDWRCTYEPGVRPANYVGDIFGSLGGTPDFGPGSLFSGRGACADSAGGATEAAAARSMKWRRGAAGSGRWK